MLRLVLATWVLLAHLIPWHQALTGESSILTRYSDFLLFLQPSASLHPAVIGFLVLSGFVITHGYGLEEAVKSNRSALGSWVIRRLFRIYPIYLLGVALGVLVFVLAADAPFLRQFSGTESITISCLILKGTGAQAFVPVEYPNCSFQGNAPLVTTSAEIALYVIFGILVALGWVTKHQWRTAIAAACLLWFTASTLVFALIPSLTWLPGFWIHASPINYLLPWLAGSSLALGRFSSKWKQVNLMVLVGSLSAIFYFQQLSGAGIDFFVVQLQLVSFTAFWIFVLHALIRVKQISWRFGNWMDFSFPLYALHAPIGIFVLVRTSNLVIALFSIFLLSILASLLVERPARRLGKRLSRTTTSYL